MKVGSTRRQLLDASGQAAPAPAVTPPSAVVILSTVPGPLYQVGGSAPPISNVMASTPVWA